MKYLDAGAKISKCGKFRTRLWRVWDKSRRTLTWIMLNPSTADGSVDDPTALKCVGFAMMWGYGAIEIINLYDYRATDPKDLEAAGWPSSENNFGEMGFSFIFGQDVMAAWGAKAQSSRVDEFLAYWPGVSMQCLGENRDGSPKHPLYVPYLTVPERWEQRLW